MQSFNRPLQTRYQNLASFETVPVQTYVGTIPTSVGFTISTHWTSFCGPRTVSSKTLRADLLKAVHLRTYCQYTTSWQLDRLGHRVPAGPRPGRVPAGRTDRANLATLSGAQASSGGKSGSPALALQAPIVVKIRLALCRRETEHKLRLARRSPHQTLHKRPSRLRINHCHPAALVTTSLSVPMRPIKRVHGCGVANAGRLQGAPSRYPPPASPSTTERSSRHISRTDSPPQTWTRTLFVTAEEHATRFTPSASMQARAQRADPADHSSHSSELVAPTASAMVDRVG